jgi:hypothetical protein
VSASSLLIVDGLPGSHRARLAQEIALQLEADGVDCVHRHVAERGHPLRRPWEPERYATPAAYADTLVMQWENFATRAGAEGGVHVMDRVLLGPPLALLAAGALDPDAARELGETLFAAVEALAPTLVYLRGPDRDADPRERAVADGVFGALEAPRVLLNTERSTPGDRLADALGLLGHAPRTLQLEASLAARLAGVYATGEDGTTVQLVAGDAGLGIRGLPTVAAGEIRDLLPAVDGRLLVAGLDLALRPQLARDGAVSGLVTASADPRLDVLPPFLPRRADPGDG